MPINQKILSRMSTKVLNGFFNLGIPFLMVVALGIVNYSIIKYFFQGEFSQNIASIEISYVEMAKFWVTGGGLWQPLWYLGYPWHVFYTPILPLLEVVLHQIGDISFAHAYRLIVASGYVLAPISLFFFVWQIGKSKTGAFIAALFYSVVPSVISLLFSGVAQDALSGLAEPRRFAILVRWGEGPHTLALAFLPLFGFFFSRYLEKKKFGDQVVACIFLAIVALTNAVALWGAMLLVLCFFLAEFTKKSSNIVALLGAFISTGIIFFGLIAFWYNKPFMATFFREGGGALSNWFAMLPWGLIVFFIFAGFVIFLVYKLTAKFTALPFSILWFLMLFGLVFAYYASGDAHTEYAPQVLRLTTEVDMALGVLVGVIVSNIYLFLVKRGGKFSVAYMAVAIISVLVIVVLMLPQAFLMIDNLPVYAKPFSQGPVGEIKKTSEYIVAKKLEELTRGTDERVVAPGNYAFWLNYFVDVPQIRGALYQSSTHFWPDHIYYQLMNGQDAQISLAWLKITNVGKLVYTTASSTETYGDYKVPQDKFESVLTPNTTISGDIFFDVPLKNNMIAKVVDAKAYKSIIKPISAIDSKPINAYVAWMEEKSDRKLNVKKISASQMKISGEIKEGEAVLVQDTFDVGWKAKGSGGWKVARDPLDFMVLTPNKSGKFEVDLKYTKPWSVYLGYLVTLLTFGYIGRHYVLARKSRKTVVSPEVGTV